MDAPWSGGGGTPDCRHREDVRDHRAGTEDERMPFESTLQRCRRYHHVVEVRRVVDAGNPHRVGRARGCQRDEENEAVQQNGNQRESAPGLTSTDSTWTPRSERGNVLTPTGLAVGGRDCRPKRTVHDHLLRCGICDGGSDHGASRRGCQDAEVCRILVQNVHSQRGRNVAESLPPGCLRRTRVPTGRGRRGGRCFT